ncbi:TetR/AcrR family transcriptional regulator [Acidisoma cellulosilytica]|uniref:TetR/AcrR family transcriptional regulator n=1 Tax=Acidisoma cellulosilyticum TaxID=2802395 RepID=A0A964E537_9PROT|nr:TetR/AcrR family transcriptional regulator [Acidisoma cellulosilyticum]MCB8882300.1 TetR/AcrR family transcriptional regulator [Acidisoma cellulosilyticum]
MMDYLGDVFPDATPMEEISTKPTSARSISETDRRLLLIAAAETVFLAKGYVATTMADIATAASMSKKTIYQIFDSKADLFDALMIERLVALPTTSVPSDEAAPDALRSMLMAFGRVLLSPRQVTLTRLILANIASVPQANEVVTRRLNDTKTGMSSWLAAQVDRGIFQIADLTLATETLFSLAFASLQTELLLALRETPTEQDLARHVDWSVGVFMREFARPSVTAEDTQPQG